MAQISFGFKT